MIDSAATLRPRPDLRHRAGSSPLVWSVIVAVLCAWFLTLDSRHLLRSDEGRYAEIAREMFASGDWVTIRYNGLKYFEKPPFHLWMTALAYHAFGVGEWQARLWVAVSGAIGLGATVLAAWRWWGPRVGVLTGLVLLAAPTWNLAAHFNSLDMSVSAALTCVLAGVLIAQHPLASSGSRRGWMMFAWAAAAVAVLTKGLIGIVLPGLVLVVYTLAARDWALWRRLHIASGALLLLALTAPWFVLVTLRNPEFPQFFFIHEHWQRYTSTVHQRSAPWWYFGPQLLAGFLPWLGLAPRMLGLLRVAAGGGRPTGLRPTWLLAAWAGAIFVFFSLSDSKLPGYIVPIFPALAVLAALALAEIGPRAWRRQTLGLLLVALLGLAASPLIARMGSDDAQNALYRGYAVWVGAACAVGAVGSALASWLNRAAMHPGTRAYVETGPARASLASISAFALAAFAAATIALVGHETLGRSASGADLVPRIEAMLEPDMPIYSVRLLDHTLPFYLRRTTIMVERPDELEFGTRQEPQKWLPTLAAFVSTWSSGRRALAIMGPDTYAALQGQNLMMVLVARDARRVVVANFSGASP